MYVDAWDNITKSLMSTFLYNTTVFDLTHLKMVPYWINIVKRDMKLRNMNHNTLENTNQQQMQNNQHKNSMKQLV